MKFKKLEVAGFKSFADRLEVKFGAGVTAIVGPNGCGKSNVADSIRWVLGEQSAKLLRGNSMQDVIFNGTENRKSLSYCEVNLYFDNTEKLFPSLEYDEVVISRKLYRSGESEYCLNKQVCRLKDITDLLRDSGMGREGYSIIGQGRIEELLRAKPEDRRAIFEEAAGISKFKARKLDAERKLARTRENIVRVEDILREKASLLEPLTKQSEAARKWLELRDKLKSHEINIYIYQFDSASQAKGAIQDRLNGVCEQIDLRQKDCDEATAKYNETMENLGDADKSINSLRDELLELTVGLEKAAGEIKVLKERLGYLNTQNERLKEEHAQLGDDYAQTESFIALGSEQVEKLNAELAAARLDAEKFDSEYLAVVDTLAQGEGEVESNHRAVVEAMDKLTEIRSNMSRLVAEREALQSLSVDLEKRISGVAEKLAFSDEQIKTLKGEIDGYVSEKNGLSLELDKYYEINNDCVAEINQAAQKIDSVSAKYYMAKSRHKMLVEMQQSYEGFAYSVKKLLSEAKQRKDLSDKIEGVVAALLNVKDGYETAIETALGNAVQNIVTRNEEDAKYLIEYLKSSRSGRATFLPMTSMKPRALEREYREFLNEKGVCGVAVELVSFDKKYSDIFSGLLGNTVVVDNMDTAIAVARKARYGFKIVTRDGEVLTPHGSITGGSKKSETSNVFGYEKDIEALKSQLDDMDKSLASFNAVREEKVKEQKLASEKIRSLSESLHKAEVEIATRTEVLNKFISSYEELNAESSSLNSELEKSKNRIESITHDFDSVESLEQIVRGKKDSANESGEEQRQQFDALRKQRDELHEKMTDARVKVSTLEGQLVSADGEIARLKANLDTISSKIQYDAGQIAENDALIAQLDAEITSSANAEGEGDSGRVKEIRHKLANLDDYKREVQNTLAALDTRRMDLINELQQLHDRKNKEEMQLLKVDTDIEQMQEKVKKDYDLEYNDCLPFKTEDYDLSKGIAEANKITRQMNALGNVNLASIEQCQEMYAGYHEMDVQREDLVKAEADLLKIISELSAEMLGKFTERFEQIRINFVKIFKELFDGGNADLLLLDSENPLDAGIEIVAQPPEKRLQSISLLSGGERALTAIAILFAILRLKPMPFCVLDEIEAALDDANAGRFAKYLRRFSEDTQFIVITHRKPTMELADSLYGVTMEEKGVSKIVSVKLSEAMKFEEGQQ